MKAPEGTWPVAVPVATASAPSYPAGTVEVLIESAAVTAPTRRALRDRLDAKPPQPPCCLDAAAYAGLVAVCDRLVPQGDRARPIPIAAVIDQRLAEGRGDGWRYDALPPDNEAYRRGLLGLNESAMMLFGVGFRELNGSEQDSILTLVQRGEAPGAAWETLPAGRFFEELLAEVVETYYAHPLAQEEIGYAGMADVPGWAEVGLGRREDREPSRTLP